MTKRKTKPKPQANPLAAKSAVELEATTEKRPPEALIAEMRASQHPDQPIRDRLDSTFHDAAYKLFATLRYAQTMASEGECIEAYGRAVALAREMIAAHDAAALFGHVYETADERAEPWRESDDDEGEAAYLAEAPERAESRAHIKAHNAKARRLQTDAA